MKLDHNFIVRAASSEFITHGDWRHYLFDLEDEVEKYNETTRCILDMPIRNATMSTLVLEINCRSRICVYYRQGNFYKIPLSNVKPMNPNTWAR